MNYKKITNEITEQVKEYRKKGYKAKLISEILGITIYQVYEIYKREKLTVHNNLVFILSNRQRQLLIAGILGDGRLKRNGKNGVYYSECHSLKEYEYCEWKFKTFGTLTENHHLYYKNKNNSSCDAIEFTTITSTTLRKYFEMSIEEVIDALDIVSFCIFLLDDGWFRKDSKSFMISGGSMTREQLNLFCLKCEYLGLKNIHIIGRKRLDVSIPKENNEKIISTIFKVIPKDIDIIKKKLYYVL